MKRPELETRSEPSTGCVDRTCLFLRCVHGSCQRCLLLQLHDCRLPEGLHGSVPVQEQPANPLPPGPERPRRLHLHLQRRGAAAGGGRPSPPQSAGELPTVRRLSELQRLLWLPVVLTLTGSGETSSEPETLLSPERSL